MWKKQASEREESNFIKLRRMNFLTSQHSSHPPSNNSGFEEGSATIAVILVLFLEASTNFHARTAWSVGSGE